jgi:hypothetical protein
MSSIFLRLWNHCSKEARPGEDYFTEIIGHLFAERPKLFYKWLEKLEIYVPDKDVVPKICLQRRFPLFATRYDFFIEVNQAEWTQLIAIESKIRSTENPEQVPKYIQHLTTFSSATVRTALIYITRNNEPKEKLDTSVVRFKQCRWKDFVEFIVEQESMQTDWLVLETIAFMKESRIAVPFDITDSHVSAFIHFFECLAFFDEVLDNTKVADEFRELGGKLRTKSSRLKSISNNWVYGHISSHNNWSIGFHVGFWRNHRQTGETSVGGYVCINRLKAEAAETLQKAREALKKCKLNWEPYKTNDVVRDPGFVWSESLEKVLRQGEQEEELTKLLLRVISDLKIFQANLDFPWESLSTEEEETITSEPTTQL